MDWSKYCHFFQLLRENLSTWSVFDTFGKKLRHWNIYSGTFILCCWLFRVLLMSEWSLLFPWPFYSYALLRINSSNSKREVGEHVNPRQNVNESFRMRQKFTIVTGLITESDIENVCFLLNFLFTVVQDYARITVYWEHHDIYCISFFSI